MFFCHLMEKQFLQKFIKKTYWNENIHHCVEQPI